MTSAMVEQYKERLKLEHTKKRIKATVEEMEHAQDEATMKAFLIRIKKISGDALKQMGEK
jgi:hypothetical protein